MKAGTVGNMTDSIMKSLIHRTIDQDAVRLQDRDPGAEELLMVPIIVGSMGNDGPHSFLVENSRHPNRALLEALSAITVRFSVTLTSFDPT